MKLTTRGKYGLLAMYEIASNADAPVSVSQIARRQDISEAYLEQLLSALKKAELITGIRGAQGGYMLAKKPADINIGCILRALESSTNVTDCLGEKQCGSTCNCASRKIYEKIQNGIDNVLDNMTLADMLENNAQIEVEQ